jgi:PAS domain-containing protein
LQQILEVLQILAILFTAKRRMKQMRACALLNQISQEGIMVNAFVYESFFENSLNALFLLKQDGNIVRANRCASEMFGYTEEEFKQIGRQGIVDTSDPSFLEMIAQRSVNGKAAPSSPV